MGRIYKPWPLENLWWSVIKGKDKLELCQPRHLSSHQWPGNYSWNFIYICRLIMSTKHSMDRNRKAINHSDLDPWSPNNKLANFLTVPSYLSYGISKENVYMYQVGRVSFFFFIINNFDDWFCSLLGLQGKVGAQRILSILQIYLKQSAIAMGNS